MEKSKGQYGHETWKNQKDHMDMKHVDKRKIQAQHFFNDKNISSYIPFWVLEIRTHCLCNCNLLYILQSTNIQNLYYWNSHILHH